MANGLNYYQNPAQTLGRPRNPTGVKLGSSRVTGMDAARWLSQNAPRPPAQYMPQAANPMDSVAGAAGSGTPIPSAQQAYQRQQAGNQISSMDAWSHLQPGAGFTNNLPPVPRNWQEGFGTFQDTMTRQGQVQQSPQGYPFDPQQVVSRAMGQHPSTIPQDPNLPGQDTSGMGWMLSAPGFPTYFDQTFENSYINQSRPQQLPFPAAQRADDLGASGQPPTYPQMPSFNMGGFTPDAGNPAAAQFASAPQQFAPQPQASPSDAPGLYQYQDGGQMRQSAQNRGYRDLLDFYRQGGANVAPQQYAPQQSAPAYGPQGPNAGMFAAANPRQRAMMMGQPDPGSGQMPAPASPPPTVQLGQQEPQGPLSQRPEVEDLEQYAASLRMEMPSLANYSQPREGVTPADQTANFREAQRVAQAEPNMLREERRANEKARTAPRKELARQRAFERGLARKEKAMLRKMTPMQRQQYAYQQAMQTQGQMAMGLEQQKALAGEMQAQQNHQRAMQIAAIRAMGGYSGDDPMVAKALNDLLPQAEAEGGGLPPSQYAPQPPLSPSEQLAAQRGDSAPPDSFSPSSSPRVDQMSFPQMMLDTMRRAATANDQRPSYAPLQSQRGRLKFKDPAKSYWMF